MKFRFDWMLRVYIFAFVLLLGWSVWRAVAQESSPEPAVRLVAPGDQERFDPDTKIVLRAVTETTQQLSHVSFLVDGQVFGSVTNLGGSDAYSLVWSNAAPGTHEVKARAVPVSGGSVDSQIIHVRVYYALLTFGLDRVPFLREHAVFSIPLWQYCASLIYIFLAFYISKFLDYLTRVWLKSWAQKTKTSFDDLLLDLLNGPIKIIAFVIFLRIGLEVFYWPGLVQVILAKTFIIVVAITLTYVTLKFIDLAMSYWKQRAKPETDRTFDEQLFPIIRKSLKIFVVVVATLVTLQNLQVDITAAIASLSIGGLAVGLAAQDTLANLFGAIAVFVDKPFRIGDRIQLDTIDGMVESIGLRSTRVRNLDGYLVTIPNKTMGNTNITNIQRRPNIKTVMNIGVTYDTPAEKVKRATQILEEVYRSHSMTQDVIVSFNQFADSSLNILVVHWWKGVDPRAQLGGMQEMNLKIKERFDAEGLSFAFPSRTVYLRQDSEWRLSPKDEAAK